jgi:hypothetical protein
MYTGFVIVVYANIAINIILLIIWFIFKLEVKYLQQYSIFISNPENKNLTGIIPKIKILLLDCIIFNNESFIFIYYAICGILCLSVYNFFISL